MRIKTIQLKHFKRFDDLTVELGNDPEKVIALVGPNGWKINPNAKYSFDSSMKGWEVFDLK